MSYNRYSTDKIVKDQNGKRFQTTNLPPKINRSSSDIYIYSKAGDRLDLLASQHYGDPAKWVFIAAANNLYEMIVPSELQIRIPRSPDEIQKEWINQNS